MLSWFSMQKGTRRNNLRCGTVVVRLRHKNNLFFFPVIRDLLSVGLALQWQEYIHLRLHHWSG